VGDLSSTHRFSKSSSVSLRDAKAHHFPFSRGLAKFEISWSQSRTFGAYRASSSLESIRIIGQSICNSVTSALWSASHLCTGLSGKSSSPVSLAGPRFLTASNRASALVPSLNDAAASMPAVLGQSFNACNCRICRMRACGLGACRSRAECCQGRMSVARPVYWTEAAVIRAK
jgi:hypothetical protein